MILNFLIIRNYQLVHDRHSHNTRQSAKKLPDSTETLKTRSKQFHVPRTKFLKFSTTSPISKNLLWLLCLVLNSAKY